MDRIERAPVIVRTTLRIEEGDALDRPVRALEGPIRTSEAARRLVGAGLLAVGPTAWTGWAEWLSAGPREKRVGVVHASTNAVAIGVYAASWVARTRGRHGAGAGLALAGATVSGVGAYLGGHLAAARKVGSRHPAYIGTAPTDSPSSAW